MQLPRWLLGACLWLLCITEVWTVTFKLALIGPWSCDPMFSRAMPTAAANLALSRLRSDSSLSRGYWYDVKLLEEDCSASKGSFTNQLKSRGIYLKTGDFTRTVNETRSVQRVKKDLTLCSVFFKLVRHQTVGQGLLTSKSTLLQLTVRTTK